MLAIALGIAQRISRASQPVGGGYLSSEETSFGILESVDYEANRIVLTSVGGAALSDQNTDNGVLVASAAMPSLLEHIRENEALLIGSRVEVKHCPIPGRASRDGELKVHNLRTVGEWIM